MKTLKEVTISELEGGYVLTKRIRTFDADENLVNENINQEVATSANDAGAKATTFLAVAKKGTSNVKK